MTRSFLGMSKNHYFNSRLFGHQLVQSLEEDYINLIAPFYFYEDCTDERNKKIACVLIELFWSEDNQNTF